MTSKIEIYKVSCKDPTITYCYIGSTKNIYKTRFLYKRNTLSNKPDFLYLTINSNGGWENWELTSLESFVSITPEELAIKLEKWNKFYNCPEKPQKAPKSPETAPNSPENTQLCSEILNTNPLQCQACLKTFVKKYGLTRHSQGGRCKPQESLKECVAEQQQIIKKLEKQLTEKDTQLVRVNNKTNNNNNNNNTINTIINNTNHIKLVELGNENITDILSAQEKKQILGKMHKSLIHLIEKVHFSGEYPQFANVVITNLKNKLAYKYSEVDQKFIVDIAEKVISEVIDLHFEDICSIYEEQKEALDKKTNLRTGEFIEQHTNNPDKYKQTANDVKLMMFNKREMVDMNTQKSIKNT